MTTIQQRSAEIQRAAAGVLPGTVAKVLADDLRRWREFRKPERIVAVGDTLDEFTLPDASGRPVALSEIVNSGPAVIVFYRGGWCPYCNLALRTYQAELAPELERWRATLVAISPQGPDQSLGTQEVAELDFAILSDAGAEVARTLGITFEPAQEVLDAQRALRLDLRKVNAAGTPNLPMPTVLIVDRQRTVRFADVRPDYTGRTEVDTILAALDGIHGAGS